MIYKRYELSQSLTGDKIVHIARNALGNVVFREPSLKKLKKAIDKSEKEKEKRAQLEAKKEAEKKALSLKRKKKSTEEEEEEEKSLKVEKEKPPEQIRRGPDGKFISKAQETEDKAKKKSFWDKLR